MASSDRTRATIRKVLIYGFLVVMAAVVVYPMLWLFTTSLKDAWSIFRDPWALPDKLQFGNYVHAWTKGELGHKFANSVVVDIISLLGILILSAMTAYVLARFAFPGNKAIFYLFLGGMALPVFLAIIPLFQMMKSMSLLNSRIGLIIVYVSYSFSFTVFVLTGFFKTLPSGLAEAAAIDGATPSGTFWRVMLPLAKPGLVAAGIFVFIGLWNEYPLALVLISSNELQTLPLGIANLTMTQKYQSDWGALFASLSIAVIPTIVLYAIFQKQIEEGLTAGAIKG